MGGEEKDVVDAGRGSTWDLRVGHLRVQQDIQPTRVPKLGKEDASTWNELKDGRMDDLGGMPPSHGMNGRLEGWMGGSKGHGGLDST